MFLICVYDYAGQFAEFNANTIDVASLIFQDCKNKWPEKAVRVYRPENCDDNFDGLSEEEREVIYG